ncbi:MAG: DHH family phosphoesterase [Clostridia bacterium]|nr:DHH family phosphoesterase [Clostridia bacterium]
MESEGRMRRVPRKEDGFSDLRFDPASKKLLSLASGGPLALLVHARPDGDCVGSAVALAHLLGLLGCPSAIVSSDPLPARLSFLIPEGGGVVFSDGQTDGIFGPGCRAVALDVAAPSQLGSLEGRYDILFSIDHHSGSTRFSDRYVDPAASATGEIIWRIARNWMRTGAVSSIPHGTAFACYAAISSDTGCFRYSNVTPATHRIAAQLVELVPEHSEIDRRLFEIKTPGRIAAEKLAMEILKTCFDGEVSVCAVSAEQISEAGLPYDELDALVDVARAVDGVKIALSVREEKPGSFRVSARSNSDADVSALCARFGGGGHVKAAGCSVFADSLGEAVSSVTAAAGELLGFPV